MLRNKVPYLPRTMIRDKALEFLRSHWPSDSIPVDIERIIENIGVEIIPEYGCMENGFNAYISVDFKSIVIDAKRYNDDKDYIWTRYTLAHEIGHLVLHKEYLRAFSVSMDFKALSDVLDDCEYGWLESHANTFARSVLVPAGKLIAECAEKRSTVYALARMFDVSHKIIEKRICDEDVAEAIVGRDGVDKP